jgi:hypothetical protein
MATALCTFVNSSAGTFSAADTSARIASEHTIVRVAARTSHVSVSCRAWDRGVVIQPFHNPASVA